MYLGYELVSETAGKRYVGQTENSPAACGSTPAQNLAKFTAGQPAPSGRGIWDYFPRHYATFARSRKMMLDGLPTGA